MRRSPPASETACIITLFFHSGAIASATFSAPDRARIRARRAGPRLRHFRKIGTVPGHIARTKPGPCPRRGRDPRNSSRYLDGKLQRGVTSRIAPRRAMERCVSRHWRGKPPWSSGFAHSGCAYQRQVLDGVRSAYTASGSPCLGSGPRVEHAFGLDFQPRLEPGPDCFGFHDRTPFA